MSTFTKTLILGIFLFCLTKAQAQDYRFHSLFVYNFTKYIQWPESTKSGDFVIGVVGNANIVGELEKVVANKAVGSQKIVVKKFKSVAEAESCQILFIAHNETKAFEAAQQSLKSKPVLVVTEKDGLAKRGSAINFVVQDGKMRFELNQEVLQTAGLKVSSQPSSLAIPVKSVSGASVADI